MDSTAITVFIYLLIVAPFALATQICWPLLSLKKYYIFAYLQIKITSLFKIILRDMQFSRVWVCSEGRRQKNNSKEEKRLKKEVPRIKPHSPSSSWCNIFIFRVYDRHNGTILKSFFFQLEYLRTIIWTAKFPPRVEYQALEWKINTDF